MKKRVSSLEQDKLRLQQTISSQRKEYEESLLSDKQEQHQQVHGYRGYQLYFITITGDYPS